MDTLDILGFLLAFWEAAKPFFLSFLVIMIASLVIKNFILDNITKELEQANSYLYGISSTTSDLNRRLMEIERTLENIKDSKR